jgi:hypothetical protein
MNGIAADAAIFFEVGLISLFFLVCGLGNVRKRFPERGIALRFTTACLNAELSWQGGSAPVFRIGQIAHLRQCATLQSAFVRAQSIQGSQLQAPGTTSGRRPDRSLLGVRYNSLGALQFCLVGSDQVPVPTM